jgi:hypothetical protein
MQEDEKNCNNNNKQIGDHLLNQCKNIIWNKYPEIYSCYDNSNKFYKCSNMLAKESDNKENCEQYQTAFEECSKKIDKNKHLFSNVQKSVHCHYKILLLHNLNQNQNKSRSIKRIVFN